MLPQRVRTRGSPDRRPVVNRALRHNIMVRCVSYQGYISSIWALQWCNWGSGYDGKEGVKWCEGRAVCTSVQNMRCVAVSSCHIPQLLAINAVLSDRAPSL